MADPLSPEAEPVSFQLDRFELDGERGLELRGRWFGLRGRRFVRPTLTMRIDGAKYRLLADLDHKPWAAEEGEEWVASFSPAPPAGYSNEFELTVAPDIAISLSAPGSRAPTARAKPSANGAATSSRAPTRRSTGRSQPPRQQRAVGRETAREVEDTRAVSGERDALIGERDALTSERDTVIGERDALIGKRDAVAAERDALAAERDGLAHERDILAAERTSVLRELALSHERVAELQAQLKEIKARAKRALGEAQSRVEAERAETNRLRRARDSREAIIADRDRLARELESALAERDAALAERNRLAGQASETGPVAPATHPAPRAVPPRPLGRAYARRRPKHAWAGRALAIIALCAVLLALALVLHVV